MPYSSIVKVKSDATVSLSEAVLNEACQTKHCLCFENGIPCVSRCHKGKTKKCKTNNPCFSVQSERDYDSLTEPVVAQMAIISSNSQDVAAFKSNEILNVQISNTTEVSITFEEKDISGPL